MRDEAGYTLAETLAALLIIGLAMGGLFEGMRLLSRIQAGTTQTVADARALRRAEAALAGLMALRHPDDRTLRGDRTSFSFDCAEPPCAAELVSEGGRTALRIRRGKVSQAYPLPAVRQANLVYDTRSGRLDRWPPVEEPTFPRAVSVIGQTPRGDIPVVAVGSWIEQSKTCAYDLVAQACRATLR